MADEVDEGMEALREIEIPWLAAMLADSIAKLGYPVGCGVAPSETHCRHAATVLFDRYAGMIEMAARTRLPAKNPDQQDRP